MNQCPEILIETIVVIILFTSIQSIILVVVFFRWKRSKSNGTKVETFSFPNNLEVNEQVNENSPLPQTGDDEYAEIDFSKKKIRKHDISDPIISDETYMNTQEIQGKKKGPGKICISNLRLQ